MMELQSPVGGEGERAIDTRFWSAQGPETLTSTPAWWGWQARCMHHNAGLKQGTLRHREQWQQGPGRPQELLEATG